MSKLKAKKKSIFEVDYNDLEQFVTETYNVEDYSFVATEECGNDSVHRIRVEGKLDKWQEKEAKEIRSGKLNSVSNSTIMEVLCVDGHIEPGEYVINVCW